MQADAVPTWLGNGTLAPTAAPSAMPSCGGCPHVVHAWQARPVSHTHRAPPRPASPRLLRIPVSGSFRGTWRSTQRLNCSMRGSMEAGGTGGHPCGRDMSVVCVRGLGSLLARLNARPASAMRRRRCCAAVAPLRSSRGSCGSPGLRHQHSFRRKRDREKVSTVFLTEKRRRKKEEVPRTSHCPFSCLGGGPVRAVIHTETANRGVSAQMP